MTAKKLKEENAVLKKIVQDIMWMSFRYADGRSTYAPLAFNLAVHEIDKLGLAHLYTGDPAENHRRFANDGMFGEWDPELKNFIQKEKL